MRLRKRKYSAKATVDLRESENLRQLARPFEKSTHTLEVRRIVERWGAEVTLLGQNVTAYSWRNGELDFGGLLARVSGTDGLRRIRFLTGRATLLTRDKAHEFFAKALPHITDPEVRTLFDELREEEIGHQNLVREAMRSLPRGPEPDPDDYVDEPAALAPATDAGGDGVASVAFSFPWERRAAARVIRRAPHPGQAMMLSGLKDWVITVLQRGQFMVDREREYSVR